MGETPDSLRSYGAYTIERELGRGGMGVVYEGVHDVLGRRAAVKVLLPSVSNDGELVERFINEARAASKIEHPSIVEVYDVGRTDDGVYIVMELLQGESLATRLKARGALPIAVVLDRARQCANALEAAHRAGIVHRDLKPDNVFLVPDPEMPDGERVKLLDFGVAKLVGTPTATAARTVTGAILGTPHYMSPEQCEGAREVDHRSDLYSLGCMVFQMITGRLPFQSPGVGGLIGMHLHVEPPTVRSLRPDVPPQLDALVGKLLAKSPDDRPQSATDVAAALAQITPGRTRSSTAIPPTPTGGNVDPHMATVATVVADTAIAAPPRRRRVWLWPVIIGGVAVAGVIAVLARDGDDYEVPDVEAKLGSEYVVTRTANPPPPPTKQDKVKTAEEPKPVEHTSDPDRDNRAVEASDRMRIALEKGQFDEVDGAYAIVIANTEPGDPLRTTADRMIAAAKARRPRPPTADEIRKQKADAEKQRIQVEKRRAEERLAGIRKQDIAVALQEVRSNDAPALVVLACQRLIGLAREQVPWERCVSAQCQIDPKFVSQISSQAPTLMQKRLYESCSRK